MKMLQTDLSKLIYLPILWIALCFHSTSFAVEIIGQGMGDSEAIAKREALADISSQISITVRSKFKTTQTVNSATVDQKKSETVGLASESTVETNSDLPILGGEFDTHNDGHQILVKATLDSSRSMRLYESRLGQLRTQLTKLESILANPNQKSSDEKYRDIMEMFTLLDEFKKLGTVVVCLGGNLQSHGIDENALHSQLDAVTQKVDSLELAAKLLTVGIEESSVYIFPPKTRNSNEITSFASLLKDKLAVHIKSISGPNEAAYTFIGEYEETAEGIDVTYHLIDRDSVAQKTNSVRVAPRAYVGLETKPKTIDFEKLLQAGVAVAGDLRVDISTNFGRRDLLFKENDEVELFVKLSEVGYFYVLGHTIKQINKNSYLLELNETEGARKFIQFVNADDANKWISIGKFQVSWPFGVEGLQVFASNRDLIGFLPPVTLDASTGLYLVANSPMKGALKTRALIKTFAKTAQTSEASLMFTTKAR